MSTANIIDAIILLTSSPDMYKRIYSFFYRMNTLVIRTKFKTYSLIVA